jgi:hypothetical protein
MKMRIVSRLALTGSVALLLGTAGHALAQDAVDFGKIAAAKASAPNLSDGAEEVLQLTRGNLGPDAVHTFVENHNLDYRLEPSAVGYLRQEGVSDEVLAAMLRRSGGPADTETSYVFPGRAPASQRLISDYQIYTSPVTAYDRYDYLDPSHVNPYAAAGFYRGYNYSRASRIDWNGRFEGTLQVISPRVRLTRETARLGHYQ